MTPSLLLQELRFQLRHGFGLAYFFVIVVYLAGLHLLPAAMAPVVLGLLIFSDPMSVGLIFVGGAIQLENSMQLVPALFVTPLSPGRFIAHRVVAFSLLGGGIALLLLLFAPDAGYTAAPLPRGVTVLLLVVLMALSSPVLTLLGTSAAYRASSINAFMLLIVPVLLLTVVPLFSWVEAVAPWWFLWTPTFLPAYLLGGLVGVTSPPAVALILLGAIGFLLWTYAAFRLAVAMLLRRLRLSVGGEG